MSDVHQREIERELRSFERRAAYLKSELHSVIETNSGASVGRCGQVARRRLLRDYKEILSCPTPGVSATPLQNDIFQWHVNLCPSSGPYKGMTLHGVLFFGDSYPTRPPKLQLGSPLSHPRQCLCLTSHKRPLSNVFDGWVCLDMLKEYTCNVPYTGWSSAYTVSTILIQLQSFLFEENAIPQDYGGFQRNFPGSSTVAAARKCAAEFKCPGCSHGSVVDKLTRCVWPPLPKPQDVCYPVKITKPKKIDIQPKKQSTKPEKRTVKSKKRSKKRKAKSKKKSKSKGTCEEKVDTSSRHLTSRRATSGLLCLEDFLWLHMCSYITVQDAHRLRQVCVHAARVHYKYNIVSRREMVCFHSKVSFKEDILGIGISATYHGNGVLRSTQLTLDVLSLTAFNQGVRRGVWKEEIHHFLPLVIDPQHGERALPHIEAVIMRICGKKPRPFDSRAPYQPTTSTSIESVQECMSDKPPPFKAEAALKVIGVAMNSLVVSIMDQLEDGPPPLHASEKALQGYAYMHHILLFLASKHPGLAALANSKVNRFLESKNGTHKKVTPSLGEFLPLLCLSQKGWDACKWAYVRESLARNVRWVLKHIAQVSRDDRSRVCNSAKQKESDACVALRKAMLTDKMNEQHPDAGLKAWFKITLTGKRLGVFQSFFVNNIGRPIGSSGWSAVLASHNRVLGKLRPGLCQGLQGLCKQVLKPTFSWSVFFREMRLPQPTKKQFTDVLAKAYATSDAREYHTLGRFERAIVERHRRVQNQGRRSYSRGKHRHSQHSKRYNRR